MQGSEKINWIGLSLAAIFVVAEFTYIGVKSTIRPGNMILAIIPAILVMSITKWLAQPELVKSRALTLAFANGALIGFSIATIISLVIYQADFLPSYIVAGLVEEFVKGALIFYILRFWKTYYKPRQVLILGLALGAGFAFTENMLYFTSAHTAEKLGLMFIGRGLITPFAHPLFTAFIAYAVGLWFYEEGRLGKRIILVGYFLASAVHSLYDWSTTFLSVLALSISVIALVFIELFLDSKRKAEDKVIRERVRTGIEHLPTIDRELLVNLKERNKAEKYIAKRSREAYRAWVSIWRGVLTNPEFIEEDVAYCYILLTELKRKWSVGYHSQRDILLDKINLDSYSNFIYKNIRNITPYITIEDELELVERMKINSATKPLAPETQRNLDFNYGDEEDTKDPFGLGGGDE